MKKSALGIAAVMTASLLALPLAACGKSSSGLDLDIDIDLTNYAVPLDEALKGSEGSNNAFTTMDAYTGMVDALFGSSVNSTLIKVIGSGEASGNNITVYNAATNTKIGDSYSSITTSYSYFAIGTTTEAEGYTFDVIADNGQVIVSDAVTEPSFSTYVAKYVGDPAERKYFTSISYKDAETDDTDTVIYVVKEGETYTKYTKDQVKDSALDTSVGTTLDAIGAQVVSARDLYSDVDADKETALDAYTYSEKETTAGKTQYTFYKDGKQCGTLTLEANESELIVVGTSLFYQKQTIVDSYATKGFNAIYTNRSYGNTSKALIEYYRYDIAKNSVSSVKSDYIFIDTGNLLYNNAKKSYDLVTADAVKKENGIAYIDSYGPQNSACVAIYEDGDMDDISDAPYDISSIVKLKEDRYCVGSEGAFYIINGKMEIVASLPDSAAPTSQGFVFTNEGRTGLADFDGKVVMTTKYESLDFYGDKALTKIYTNDELSDEYYIVSANDPDGKLVSAVVSYDETAGESLITDYDGLIVKSTADGYTVYNYDGTKLGETISVSYSYPRQVCGYWTLYVTDNGTITTYLIR